eukprot:9342372-Pyramimonas_sp.AAC.1
MCIRDREVEESKMPSNGSKTAPDDCKVVRRQLKRPLPGIGNGSRECPDRQRAPSSGPRGFQDGVKR